MLVTDVGDVMCWRQLTDVGDGILGHLGQQLSFRVTSGSHQYSKIVTNFMSPTSLSPISSRSYLTICALFKYEWFRKVWHQKFQ